MPTDLPERKGPSIGAKVGAKLAEYALVGVAYVALTSVFALWLMASFGIMHEEVPAVPAFGFMFLLGACWATWAAVSLVLWTIDAVTVGKGE